MDAEQRPELNHMEAMDSASRRDFMKVAGVGALGLAYSHPIVETLHHSDPPGQDYGGGQDGNGSKPGGSSSSESSGQVGSSSSSTGSNS